jgi:hypothetical protein
VDHVRDCIRMIDQQRDVPYEEKLNQSK